MILSYRWSEAKVFIGANEELCRLIRNPVKFFLIAHFVFKSSTDSKCQLMTSFSLRITWMILKYNCI